MVKTTPDRQSVYFRNWYLRNKEMRNAKRREKYKEDAEYREAAKTRALVSYYSNKEGGSKKSKKQIPLFQLKVSCFVDVVIRNPQDKRYGSIVRLPCYSIRSVSRMFGLDAGELSSLWNSGLLVDFRLTSDIRRVATLHQMLILDELKGYIKDVGGYRFDKINEYLTQMLSNMPDKVFPQYDMRKKDTGEEGTFYVYPANKVLAVKLNIDNTIAEAYDLSTMEVLHEN